MAIKTAVKAAVRNAVENLAADGVEISINGETLNPPKETSTPRPKITKVKLGKEPTLEYVRELATGNEEFCTLKLYSFPQDLETAMNRLIGFAIDICALNEEVWQTASVTGLTLKYGDELGFTSTLVLKGMGPNSDKAICLNTPFINAEDVDSQTFYILDAIQSEAVKVINEQPVQTSLDI